MKTRKRTERRKLVTVVPVVPAVAERIRSRFTGVVRDEDWGYAVNWVNGVPLTFVRIPGCLPS